MLIICVAQSFSLQETWGTFKRPHSVKHPSGYSELRDHVFTERVDEKGYVRLFFFSILEGHQQFYPINRTSSADPVALHMLDCRTWQKAFEISQQLTFWSFNLFNDCNVFTLIKLLRQPFQHVGSDWLISSTTLHSTTSLCFRNNHKPLDKRDKKLR